MKLIKKKLLALRPDPVPAGWPEEATEHQVLAVGAGKRKYEGGWLFCATWYQKSGAPYARLFLGKDNFVTYLYESRSWTDKAIDKIPQPNDNWNCLDSEPRMYLPGDIPALLKACGQQRKHISKSSPLYLIESIQRSMRSRRYALADRRREEAAQYNIRAMQPPPPEDLVQVLRQNDILTRVYVLFRRQTRRATKTRPRQVSWRCRCTHCGAEYTVPDDVYSTQPCHNGIDHCPDCFRQATFIELSRLRSPHTDKASVLVFNRVDGDQILAVSYTVERCICRDGRDVVQTIDEDAYLFVPGRAIRYAKWWAGYMGKKEYLTDWDYREGIPGELWRRAQSLIYPIAPGLFDGTVLENAHLQLYLDTCAKWKQTAYPTRYCDMLLRYPGMENLLVNKFFEILQEKLLGTKAANQAVRWRETSPAKMLELNRAEQRRMKREHWDAETLLAYKKMRKAGWEMTDEDLQMFREMGQVGFARLHLSAKDTARLYRYIRKQRARQPDQAVTSIASTWKDYYEAGLALEYDFEDPAVLFPTRLGDAHDRAISAREYAENPKLLKKFAAVYKKLAPLAWERDGLCIRPAANERELIAEGRVLSHCVGGYGHTHCGGSPIFFVRRASDPGLPYFTLQLNTKTGTVIQNRGYKNCSRPPEVKAFEEAWLAEVVARFDFTKGKFTREKAPAAHPAA